MDPSTLPSGQPVRLSGVQDAIILKIQDKIQSFYDAITFKINNLAKPNSTTLPQSIF